MSDPSWDRTMSQADRDKWNARYREGTPYARPEPTPYLVSLDDLLPRRGRALDLAGGAGRNAVWLARRGLEVTLVDISREGLDLARAAAARAGLALALVESDLEDDPLPAGPFDLILSFNFLRRELFPAFADRLAPGGLLVYLQATHSNLQRHSRPPATFLLADGELPGLIGPLEVVRYQESWFDDLLEGPRHEARLVARKP
jgi:SAM-dependent methyltransferase